ncbi:MAG: T9SS type A sorting domain-containing protein [Chloroherpetonaceae bacterium]
MKRLFKIAIGGLILLMMAGISSQIKAQVYGEFDMVRVIRADYTPLPEPDGINGVVFLDRQLFALPPNFNVPDYDDGYKAINIGFDFEFNGEVYNKLWININGFITFGKKENNVVQFPPFLRPNDNQGLFLDAVSYPVNVIAPFWGDHYYRGEEDLTLRSFLPSQILYQSTDNVLTIEWKNLNINYNYEGRDLKNSIANFQVKLIKSTDPFNKQGDIEFYYGSVGGNPYLSEADDDRILTRGAAIGIKGEGKLIAGDADYMNAFINDMFLADNPMVAPEAVTTSRALSNDWPPTYIKEGKFLFTAQKTFHDEMSWGDGDVDFSKAPGAKHYNFGYPNQARYVTVNDARLILKAVAMEKPLDPVKGREAYHADVDHNGRYYYDVNLNIVPIKTKSVNYWDDLPGEVSSLKQILFSANEYDAATILQYLAGKASFLPWYPAVDSFPIKGKVNEEISSPGIYSKDIVSLGNGVYQIPIYLTSIIDGPLGLRANINAEILDVIPNNSNTLVSFMNNKIVLASGEKFVVSDPICYVNAKINGNILDLTKIALNDNDLPNQSYKLNVGEESTNMSVTNTPNPITNNFTSFIINVPKKGSYSLNVYDEFGREIANVFSSELENNQISVNWNTGNLAAGLYIYRLQGEGWTATGKMIVK